MKVNDPVSVEKIGFQKIRQKNEEVLLKKKKKKNNRTKRTNTWDNIEEHL